MTQTSRWLVGSGAVAVLSLAMAACGDGVADRGSGGPSVVATTGIWRDVVANVACDGLVEVESIIPDGSDAHEFEPSLADRARLDDAALIVANGLLLEDGLLDAIDAAESAGTPVFAIGDHVATMPYQSSDLEHDDEADGHEDEEADGHEDEADGHDHEGAVDPHIWFDPARVAAALPSLADALVEHAGLDRAAIDGCVEAYQAELTALDENVVELVAAVPAADRRLVTSHESLGYFADRYGFEIVATVSPSPSGMAETNPARLEALIEILQDTGVRVVFTDAQSASGDAEALARRVDGAEVVDLPTEALGGPDGGPATYVELVESVAESITGALAG